MDGQCDSTLFQNIDIMMSPPYPPIQVPGIKKTLITVTIMLIWIIIIIYVLIKYKVFDKDFDSVKAPVVEKEQFEKEFRTVVYLDKKVQEEYPNIVSGCNGKCEKDGNTYFCKNCGFAIFD